MALRDQPYIPLYIQDFLTDEKLIECSASATGVYVRIMCIMHKSEDYGKILLKQKDKQTSEQINNFALKLAKAMPYPFDVVLSAIKELLSEGVLHLEGDFLCQKRMIKDNHVSLLRAESGSKGGKLAQAKVKAKKESNTEYETETENAFEIIGNKGVQLISVKAKYVGEKPKVIYDLQEYFKRMNQLDGIKSAGWDKFDKFMEANPSAVFDEDSHVYNAYRKFCLTHDQKNGKRNIDDL